MLSNLVVVLVLFWGVESFPDGAPVDACVKDRPNQPNHGQHRTQPLSTLPYRVVASSSSYGPNSPITVSIEGVEPFKGFFLQARSVETDQWLGQWEQAPNTTVHPECSAITHADPRDKSRATLIWRAPPDSQGKVYFTGTVLKNYGTFWSSLVAEAPQEPAQLQVLG
ncbi:putative defense protein 3 [Pectinophora gossypiella]|uniref:putative defense protein 3 n=1 Tax=Pectinophora gossypiella TaxID=13191 RepID=UPI00214E8B7E|nr:putative defense protein 3 [Pectinophora gossypiella]